MKLISPEIGLYRVFTISTELHNGKPTPVAEVFFKEPKWENFSSDVQKIRLRALYNPSSIGPKDEFPVDKLQYQYIHIEGMEVMADPKNPNKQLYTVIWDVIRSEESDEYVEEMKAIESDFALQEMVFNEGFEEVFNIIKMEDIEKQIKASDQVFREVFNISN